MSEEPTAEERDRARMQRYIQLLEKEHGVKFSDIMDAVRWLMKRRERESKLVGAAYLALVSIVVAASLRAGWEGFVSILKGVMR